MDSHFRIIAVVLLLLLSSCKDKGTATSWQQMELKGKVKKMVVSEYRLKANKKKTDTVIDSRLEYYFNNRGYLVKEVVANNERIESWTVYTFDASGKPVQAKKHNGDSSFCYKTNITFDKDGKVVMRTTVNEHDSVHLRVAVTYNENGRISGEDSYWANNIVLHRYRWLYNPKGQQAVFYQLRNDSSQLMRIAYSYDSLGHIAEEKRYDGDDIMALNLKFSYPAHDATGNWIQQFVVEKSKPTTWITRVITYF